MAKRSVRQIVGKALTILTLSATLSACALSGNQPIGHAGRLAVAEQFLRSGDYDRAYDLLDTVAEERGQTPKVWLDLGDLYLRNTAFLKAEQAFQRAGTAGDQIGQHIGLGRVSLARNDGEQAATYFNAVLAADPNNAIAINGLGVAADLRGDHSQAQGHYRNAYSIDPDNLDPLNNLGLSLALGGNATSAVSVLTDVARSNRNDPVTRQNLALVYALAGRREEALRLAKLDIGGDQAVALVEAVLNYRTARR